MQTSELTSWLHYLETLHSKPIDLGLARVSQVAAKLDATTFSCPTILVGGTNGKGSCVHCLESIYLAAGYRVGAYTSPHLHQFNERIRINGKPVADELLVIALQLVEQARANLPLTFFEFTTLAALLLFQQSLLDVVVLEVGLGGRLDAVNIVDATVALITSIDLDHMDWLGQDRESIGFEKAGIFRAKCPVICGDTDPPQSLLQHAQQLQAPLYQLNRDFHYQDQPFNWEWHSQRQHLQHLPALRIKRQNAASSLMAIELLSEQLPVTPIAIIRGLQQVNIPGRFQSWSEPVSCWFDVAHNPQAGRWLAHQLTAVPCTGKRIAIVGMLADKDIEATVAPMASCVDRWHAATLSVPRGAASAEIYQALAARQIKNCYTFASVEEAIDAAIQAEDFVPQHDQLLIFGSFYTVAAAQVYLMQRRR